MSYRASSKAMVRGLCNSYGQHCCSSERHLACIAVLLLCWAPHELGLQRSVTGEVRFEKRKTNLLY